MPQVKLKKHLTNMMADPLFQVNVNITDMDMVVVTKIIFYHFVRIM